MEKILDIFKKIKIVPNTKIQTLEYKDDKELSDLIESMDKTRNNIIHIIYILNTNIFTRIFIPKNEFEYCVNKIIVSKKENKNIN